MLRILPALLTLLTLAAAQQTGEVINDYLRLALPTNADLIRNRVDDDGRDSDTTFRSRDTIATLFAFFDEQLIADDWTQTEYNPGNNEIEAEYSRNGAELTLELERNRDGTYTLEVDV